MSSSLNIEIALPAEWGRIEPTREAVGFFLKAMFDDEGIKGALAMVSAELLENAVKYSKPESHLRLAVRAGTERVEIAVTNPIDARSTHLESLRARFEWLAQFTTAAEAYAAALVRFAEHLRPEDRGVGIYRIAYEGDCRVDVDLSEAGQVTVRASYAIPGMPAAA